MYLLHRTAVLAQTLYVLHISSDVSNFVHVTSKQNVSNFVLVTSHQSVGLKRCICYILGRASRTLYLLHRIKVLVQTLYFLHLGHWHLELCTRYILVRVYLLHLTQLWFGFCHEICRVRELYKGLLKWYKMLKRTTL